jgi:hypothetical protein
VSELLTSFGGNKRSNLPFTVYGPGDDEELSGCPSIAIASLSPT